MNCCDINVDNVFDETDTSIRNDVLRMIVEHLNKEKLFTAANILEDEINTRLSGLNAKRVRMGKFHKAVLHGDWDLCVKHLGGLVPKSSQKNFLYHLLRQQYLELIDAGEREAALTLLVEQLKPLEHIAAAQGSNGNEFKELCYLLTCKAVGEADGQLFRSWTHYSVGREQLADHLVQSLFAFMREESGIFELCPPQMLSHHALYPATTRATVQDRQLGDRECSRLVNLLKQSFAYQVQRKGGLTVDTGGVGERERALSSSDRDGSGSKGGGAIPVSVAEMNSLMTTADSAALSPAAFSDSLVSQDGSLSTSLHTNYPCVRRLTEDYIGEHTPTRMVGVLKPYAPTGHREDDVPPTHVLSCMAFINGEQATGDKGMLMCGTDRGTLLEYRYDQSARCTTVLCPARVISIPGVSSMEGLLVEPFEEGCRKIAVTNKRQTNVKIRDISTDSRAKHVCVGSSDGTLTLLKRTVGKDFVAGGLGAMTDHYAGSYELLARSKVHEGDCYATFMQSSGEYNVSGGFDRSVAVYDVSTSSVVKVFKGHSAPVMSVGCNRPGNLVFSASKDGTVKFWDLLSGGCVKTLCVSALGSSFPLLGSTASNRRLDITSASLSSDGLSLLISARFCPSRTIDLRSNKVLVKYIDQDGTAGSMNSFYQSCFCGNDTAVVAGKQHGAATVWSGQSGKVLHSLQFSTLNEPLKHKSHTSFGSYSNFYDNMCNSEVTRCTSDRYSSVVGTLTAVGIGLWGY